MKSTDVKSCTTEHYIDLSICIECNNCELGCAARHGQNRLQRQNFTEQSVTEIIPRTCKQCYHRSCVKVCRYGAMRVDQDTGIVIVAQNCVGCGLCAESCPHKAITMVERHVSCTVGEHGGNKGLWHNWFVSKKKELKVFANKCDLCIGHRDLACVKQCPTGALKLRIIKGQEKLDCDVEEAQQSCNTCLKKCCLCDEGNCAKCKLCAQSCPVQAIAMDPYPIIKDECIGCGLCVSLCPTKALALELQTKPLKGQSLPKGYTITIKGDEPCPVQVAITLDSEMQEAQLREMITVIKAELQKKI